MINHAGVRKNFKLDEIMKKRTLYLEFSVGVFLLLGIACLGYLSVRLAGEDLFTSGGYAVNAEFSNISGLNTGAPVEIAGVEVGHVESISLQDYYAHVRMILDEKIELQTDVIASIKTKGLFGEKYIDLTPGAEEEIIAPEGKIVNTEPAFDLTSLIAKFVHGGL